MAQVEKHNAPGDGLYLGLMWLLPWYMIIQLNSNMMVLLDSPVQGYDLR